MTMPEAFKTSCVWYFRQLIDRIGPEKMQRYLNRYRYGNRDASDWPGKLNHDTDVKELKGFWIESSLQISPAEQVRVLSEIFAADTPAARELKNIMQITGGEIKIYGKTGLGTDGPLVKDAWFVGFYEYRGQTVFFAVRLNDQSRPEIKDYASSASRIARQIAIEIINQEHPLLI